MKKFFAWMKDTGGIGAYVGLIIIAVVLVIAYGSVIFNWNNIYSKSVHSASGWWHVAGWVLTAGAIFIFSKAEERGGIIAGGVALALSLCAFTGFFS